MGGPTNRMCLKPLTLAECCAVHVVGDREGARPTPVERCRANQTRAGAFVAKRSRLCVCRQSCGSKGDGKEAGAESSNGEGLATRWAHSAGGPRGLAPRPRTWWPKIRRASVTGGTAAHRQL